MEVTNTQAGIRNFLDELLLPLLGRIFESLNKPVEGTDDVVEQTSMRKAYLSFLLTLLNHRMEAIFVSDGLSRRRVKWLMISQPSQV